MPTNPPIANVSGPSTGFKVAGAFTKIVHATTSVVHGLLRGFGGPTGLYSSATTDQLMHLAVTQTYDDAIQTSTYAVDDSPAVELCGTPLANRKCILISMEGTALATVYFGGSGVTASSTTRGFAVKLDADGYAAFPLYIGVIVDIYAITSAGASVQITCLEMA